MFRTRFLDQSVRSIRAEGPFLTRQTDQHRAGGQDSAWLAFLKTYFAHRIYTQPNLHPRCPEYLIHRAADWLGEILNDNSEKARLHYVKTLCQVGFWENCCCFERLLEQPCCQFIDDCANYIDSTLNASAKYDEEAPLKQILLDAAIYLGDVNLAKKVYTLKPVEDYQYNVEASHAYAYAHNDAAECSGDRSWLSVVHGGLEMFKLVNRIELGIETDDQYPDFFDRGILMEYIVATSRSNSSSSRINFLIDVGAPWDAKPNSAWMMFDFAYALVHAPSPNIFERLAAILGPETNALTAKSVKLCCRKDSMIFHLDRSAAANNLVMVKYLLDHGGAPYLNNAHTECELRYQQSAPARSDRPTGYWRQWLLNPLIRAVEVGNAEMVKLMLANGADPNYNQFNTPLIAAVRLHNIGIARLLIDHGADVNLGPIPPVVLAVQGENLHMFKFLWGNGAIINTPETGGKAMGIINNEGLDSMRGLLIDKGVEIDAMWNHVQSEEEFVLELRYSEISAVYGYH